MTWMRCERGRGAAEAAGGCAVLRVIDVEARVYSKFARRDRYFFQERFLRYRFVAGDDAVTGQVKVNGAVYEATEPLTAQALLQVRYLPSDPEVHSVEGGPRNLNRWACSAR